jgi:hypothetical protein
MRSPDVNSDAVMSGLKAAGWSLAEWATDAGHAAHAHRDGHRITVTARSTAVAWLVLWMKLTGPRRVVGGG